MAKESTTSFEDFSFAEGLDDDVELALEIQQDMSLAGEHASRVQCLGPDKWIVRGDAMDLILVSQKAFDGFARYLDVHADGFDDLEARAGYERAMDRDE